MKSTKEQDLIQRRYREDLRREIDWAGLRSEKAAFVKREFPLAGPFVFRPAVAVPALVLAMLLIWVGVELRPSENQLAGKPQGQEALLPGIGPAARSLERPPVKVRRLTSQVGPVMVYQKAFEDAPVTVIWVFSKPAGLPVRGTRA